jgi:hypothetical protein
LVIGIGPVSANVLLDVAKPIAACRRVTGDQECASRDATIAATANVFAKPTIANRELSRE